jgi:phenylpyruvate tautomerase PptA (4-oxalocrotonate tautomerase family)
MIDITFRRDTIDTETTGRLADTLLATLLRWEGAPDNEAARSLAWAFIHAVDDVRVAGDPDGDPYVRIGVTTPEGALDDERRAGLVEEVTADVLRVLGLTNDFDNAFRVWVHIHEIDDGNWGAAGRIWRFTDVAHYVTTGEPPDGSRAHLLGGALT